VEAAVRADVRAAVANRLEVAERFAVADGPADLDDDDLRLLLARHAMDPLLDLVGDVWDHLHGRAEVVAAALLGDDRVVDLAGREIRSTRHVAVDEPLVVSKIE